MMFQLAFSALVQIGAGEWVGVVGTKRTHKRLCSAGHGCSWLQTQLGIFDANGLAEAVPQIHEVRD
ncbi:hypothetical protein, partial [Paraburkholderia atlantica]